MATTTDVYTFHDYLDTVDENQKAHLLDGIITMESPASTRHERLQNFLAVLVGTYVAEKELGEVFGSHAAFRLKGHNAVEPDLSFVTTDRLHLVTTNYVNGPPDLAVEIISKGTRKLDYEQKKPAYENAATPELWIIDYLEQQADFFCYQDGRLVQQPLNKKRYFISRVLPGFRLDIQWFWKDPLPKPASILKKLLS